MWRQEFNNTIKQDTTTGHRLSWTLSWECYSGKPPVQQNVSYNCCVVRYLKIRCGDKNLITKVQLSLCPVVVSCFIVLLNSCLHTEFLIVIMIIIKTDGNSPWSAATKLLPPTPRSGTPFIIYSALGHPQWKWLELPTNATTCTKESDHFSAKLVQTYMSKKQTNKIRRFATVRVKKLKTEIMSSNFTKL